MLQGHWASHHVACTLRLRVSAGRHVGERTRCQSVPVTRERDEEPLELELELELEDRP